MNDDSFESYVKDFLETIRQDDETIKNKTLCERIFGRDRTTGKIL